MMNPCLNISPTLSVLQIFLIIKTHLPSNLPGLLKREAGPGLHNWLILSFLEFTGAAVYIQYMQVPLRKNMSEQSHYG